MKPLSRKTIAGRVEFWRDELAKAPHKTICRLRYCFPDLTAADLLRMAERHPATARNVGGASARARGNGLIQLAPHPLRGVWSASWL